MLRLLTLGLLIGGIYYLWKRRSLSRNASLSKTAPKGPDPAKPRRDIVDAEFREVEDG